MTAQAPEDDMAVSTSELQGLLLSTAGIEEFLQEVAVLAARRVVEGASCGITVRRDGRPLTVGSSDDLAAAVDEIQYGIENGPCLHAMRTGEVVSVPDTAGDPRWAGFEARAAEHGVRSSLSMPVTDGDQRIGALNLYAPARGAFGDNELRRAEGFAATASGALALAIRQARQADLTEQLRAAMASRMVIDQALGIVMAQQRCTSAAAFDILRGASQNRNVKLHDVAASIITGITGEPPHPAVFRDS